MSHNIKLDIKSNFFIHSLYHNLAATKWTFAFCVTQWSKGIKQSTQIIFRIKKIIVDQTYWLKSLDITKLEQANKNQIEVPKVFEPIKK